MAGYTSSPPRGKNPYMGAVVGRVANRIADGKFSLDGKEYHLAKVSFSSVTIMKLFQSQIFRTTAPMRCTEVSLG